MKREIHNISFSCVSALSPVHMFELGQNTYFFLLIFMYHRFICWNVVLVCVQLVLADCLCEYVFAWKVPYFTISWLLNFTGGNKIYGRPLSFFFSICCYWGKPYRMLFSALKLWIEISVMKRVIPFLHSTLAVQRGKNKCSLGFWNY